MRVSSQTVTTYDTADRVTKTDLRDASSSKIATMKAYNGWTVTSTDGNLKTTDSTSDAFGNLASVVERNGAASYTSTYGYDAANRMTLARDSLLHDTTTSYDLLGRKTGSTDPDAGGTLNGYDPVGNLTLTADARGKWWSVPTMP